MDMPPISVYTLEDDLIAVSYGTDDWRGDLSYNEYYYILTDSFNNQYIKNITTDCRRKA